MELGLHMYYPIRALRDQTCALIGKLADAPAYHTPNRVVAELASHCAVLTLELEQAHERVRNLEVENAALREQLAAQRQTCRVIAFPVPPVVLP